MTMKLISNCIAVGDCKRSSRRYISHGRAKKSGNESKNYYKIKYLNNVRCDAHMNSCMQRENRIFKNPFFFPPFFHLIPLTHGVFHLPFWYFSGFFARRSLSLCEVNSVCFFVELFCNSIQMRRQYFNCFATCYRYILADVVGLRAIVARSNFITAVLYDLFRRIRNDKAAL